MMTLQDFQYADLRGTPRTASAQDKPDAGPLQRTIAGEGQGGITNGVNLRPDNNALSPARDCSPRGKDETAYKDQETIAHA